MVKKITKICSLLLTCFFMLFAISACGDKEISSLEIKTGTMKYIYEKGETVSLDDLIVIVKYNDDTKFEVQYGDENLTVAGITTETTGKKEVTITYLDKSIKIEITVVNPSPGSVVKSTIEALPEVNSITLENRAAIVAARNAYNALTSDTERTKVTNLAKLVGAEEKIAQLDFEAYKVSKKIELANYKNLNNYNSANKSVIQGYINEANTAINQATDKSSVDSAVAMAKNSIDAVKVLEVTNVEDLIAALPEASAVELENKTAIQAARAAYNAISTTANKALVSNYSKLIAAEDALVLLMDFEELKEENKILLTNYKIQTNYNSQNWTVIQEIIATAHLAIDQATTPAEITSIVNEAYNDIDAIKVKVITDVEEAISNLPDLTALTIENHKALVESIRDSYEALSATNKALVSNIATLEASEAKILELYKLDAKAKFAKYLSDNNVVEDNYSPSSWENIPELITNANNDIDAATTMASVDEVLNQARENIDRIPNKDEEEYYIVTGWETPKSIDDRTANLAVDADLESGFKDKDNMYVVGDDNPFVFLPDITALNKNNQVVDEVITEYRTITKVYMSETPVETFTNDHLLSGSELTNYVDVSEFTFSFDFTENAIGKYFKIEVLPYYNTLNLTAQSLSFKVVDGYNVTNAKELGVMHNYDRDGGVFVAAWDEFLNNNGIYNPTTISGIVIHNNINVQDKDIPSAYFDVNGKLIDYADIYYHSVPSGSEFNFYGNYFTIDAENVSYVDLNTALDNVSHSLLFKINNGTCRPREDCAMAENTYANFYDVSLKGNANKSTNNNGFAGLIMGKFSTLETKLENVLIRCFYINIFAGSDDETVGVLNINKVKAYDAFNNNLFVWGGHTINITDSEMKRCGGPAIIAQHIDPDKNITTIPKLNISQSNIEAYVAGNENWFSYLQLTTLAGVIKALDASLYDNTDSTGFVGQAGTTASDGLTSVQDKMNVVAVIMSNSMGQSSAIETQGKVTINDQVIADLMNESSIVKLPGDLNALYTTNVGGMTPPVLVTDLGAVATSYDGSNVTVLGPNAEAFGYGDYLTIYQGGMAIVLSHNINPAKD